MIQKETWPDSDLWLGSLFSGARILYKYLPVNVGLRRIVFYKRHDLHLLKSKRSTAPGLHHSSSMDGPFELSSSAGGTSSEGAPLISYVLLCECLTLTESILTSACAVIDQLRARCCGYSALYINSSLNFPNDDHNHQRDSWHVTGLSIIHMYRNCGSIPTWHERKKKQLLLQSLIWITKSHFQVVSSHSYSYFFLLLQTREKTNSIYTNDNHQRV